MITTVKSGHKAEQKACRILRQRGYRIFTTNFTTKIGEIDIIAQENNCLVFVEVKMRRSLKWGYPEEAVTERKLNTISRVGQIFTQNHPQAPQKKRIDVLALGPKKRIKLLKNVTQL